MIALLCIVISLIVVCMFVKEQAEQCLKSNSGSKVGSKAVGIEACSIAKRSLMESITCESQLIEELSCSEFECTVVKTQQGAVVVVVVD